MAFGSEFHFVDDGDETFAKEIGVTAILLFELHENLPENEGYG